MDIPSHDVGVKFCSFPKCENTYKPHHWGKKRAATEGWFFQKNGKAWCPNHTPGWVKNWRSK